MLERALPAIMTVVGWAVAACGDGAPSVACLPANERGEQGEQPRAIARVDRCPVSTHSLRFGFALLVRGGEEGRHAVFDGLVARELLAQGAQEAGDRPLSTSEVEGRIAKGELFVLGIRAPAELIAPEGMFDHGALKQFAGRAGVSVPALVAEQGREMLAQKMRDRLGEAAVGAWLAERCQRLAKAGRISFETEVLARADDEGKPLPSTYVACAAWESR